MLFIPPYSRVACHVARVTTDNNNTRHVNLAERDIIFMKYFYERLKFRFTLDVTIMSFASYIRGILFNQKINILY